MGTCKACSHEYDRHLFGGMCFYCDCKRAVYDLDEPVLLKRHDPAEGGATNGRRPDKRTKKPRRLGSH